MKRKILGNAAAQILPLSFAIFDRIVLLAVLVRAMGPETYGDWVTLYSAASLMALAEFGMGVYFGNRWQQANAVSDPVQLQRYLSLSLAVYACLCAMLSIGLILFAAFAPLHELLALSAVADHEATVIMSALGLVIVLRMLRGSVSQLYRGMQRFARGTLISEIPNMTWALVVLSLALLDMPLVGLALGGLAVELFFAAPLMVLDIKRSFPSLRLLPKLPSRQELADIVRLCKWFAVVQGAPNLWLQIPILYTSRFAEGAIALVGFVSMRVLANFVRTLIELFMRSFSVEVMPMYHRGETEALNRYLMLFGVLSAGLSATMMGVLTHYAAPLLTLWTGRPDVYDPVVLALLLVPTAMVVPVLPLRMIFEFANTPQISATAYLLQLGLMVLALLVLPVSDPVLRIALALALGETIGFLGFMLIRINRLIQLRLGRYLALCLAVFAAVYALAWGAGWLSSQVIPPEGALGFTLSIALLLGLMLPPILGAGYWMNRRRHIGKAG